jgi:uncharacterized lipoprotein YmbA
MFLLIVLYPLLFDGCGGPSKFYHLYPTIPSKEGSFRVSKKVIGVAEVKLADYIDKPQIITQKEGNLMDIHEKESWAGDFGKNIQMVISQNLNRSVDRYHFVSLPSEEVTEDRYRVFVTINRFDSSQDGSVTLEGRWSLKNIDNSSIIVTKAFNYTLNRIDNRDKIDSIVETKSLLLEKVSRDIALNIKKSI